MKYVYLTWTLLLGVFWLLGYTTNPKLRKKIMWSSLIALPFGFGELYYYPNYWTPQTLFNLNAKYGFDIETLLLMFFLGGLAGWIYEGILKKGMPMKQKFCNKICTCYSPVIVSLVTFIFLLRLYPGTSIIYPTIYALMIGGALAYAIYPGLRKHIILGGVLFAFLYWASLAIIELVFPGWIASTWNMAQITGLQFFKIPLEEIMFGFVFGTVWAPLYEEVCSNLNHKNKK